MPTNIYVDNFNSSAEQKLIEDIIVECIKFHGHDVYYLPRKASGQLDPVYGEDPGKYFDEAYILEMYIKDVEGWGGERDIMTRFGLEIREQITLQVAIRRFNDLLVEHEHLPAIMTRPREGDLLYLRFNHPNTNPSRQGTFLEIKFVEHESIFYQLGSLQVYEIICETFRYSQEEFSTGIIDIDQAFANNYSEYVLTGNNMPDSINSDNTRIEDEGISILDLSEDSPFGDYS